MSVQSNVVTPQSNKPVMGIVQDALLGCYLMSQPGQFCDRARACDLAMHLDAVPPPPDVVSPRALWSGATLLSMSFPDDFDYEDAHVCIRRGQLVRGTLSKRSIGTAENGVVHRLYHDYGSERAVQWMTEVQVLVNHWLVGHSFSIGVEDCCVQQADALHAQRVVSETTAACDALGVSEERCKQRCSRARDAAAAPAVARASQDRCNAFGAMLAAGSKGSKINIAQVSVCLGQQMVEGKRVGSTLERVLPHFCRFDRGSAARGFVCNSYLCGLTPQEFWFHMTAGREGLIDTAVKTSETGYLERQLVKVLENVKVVNDGTVRDGAGHVLQFVYGDDGYDGSRVYRDEDHTTLPFMPALLDKWARLPDSAAPIPEALPPTVRDWLERHTAAQHWRGDRVGLFADVLHRHETAMAVPGEMTGVLAAQSISELATQLTLNTFHLAGVNNSLVVGGVPRLKELLHASERRYTVRIRCDDAEAFAARHAGRVVRDAVRCVDVQYGPLEHAWAERCARFFYPEQVSVSDAHWWVVLHLNEDAALHIRDLLDSAMGLMTLCTHTTDSTHAVAVLADGMTPELRTAVVDTSLQLGLHGVQGATMTVVRDGLVGVTGGNVMELLACPEARSVIPDNPVVCCAYLGVEAARECLVRELKAVLDLNGSYVNYRHLALLADAMCYAGDVAPFNRHGLRRRGGTVVETASFETATTALCAGAVAGRVSNLQGVSEAVLLGRLAPLGTGLNEMRLNEAALDHAVSTEPVETIEPVEALASAFTPDWPLEHTSSPTTGTWSPVAPSLDFDIATLPVPTLP